MDNLAGVDNSALSAPHDVADDPRWAGLAFAAIAVHQLHSAAVEPGERRFRATVLVIDTVAALSAALPLSGGARRARGAVWAIMAVGPLAGAVVGHLTPIIRGRPIPAATESATLNVGGGALLLALGLRDVLRGSREARGRLPEANA
ncbi:MAG: hypothetical protein QM692_18525 [Thermomicrobiales bacterium]